MAQYKIWIDDHEPVYCDTQEEAIEIFAQETIYYNEFCKPENEEALLTYAEAIA